MISSRTLMAAVAATTLSIGAASAASLTFTDSVGVATTDFAGTTLSVSQFDPSLGTLTSIDFTLNGLVEGTADAENLDASATDIDLNLQAEITASTSVIDILAVVLPVASETFMASAFDGSIDFGGTSGTSLGALSATDTDMRTLTGADMAEFIGLGTIDIFLRADGTSIATGGGNIISSFATRAGGDIEVTYNFDDGSTPVIPLPAGFPLLLAGMGALYVVRRNRNKNA